jgi:hypothetical protein
MSLAARTVLRDARSDRLPELPEAEREVRLAALRAGWWLGWLSIAAVLAGLALDIPARHRPALIALTVAAAAAHAVVMLLPWQGWRAAGGWCSTSGRVA